MVKEKKNSILIVDDEESNALILSNMLSADYNIFIAANGREAIGLANEHLPDIVLLDIMMPEMDGYEVFSILKNGERTSGIPVIFITGLSDPMEEEKGLGMGAADYICKPFNPFAVKLRVKYQIQIINDIKEIELMSKTDQLTGIHNRRSFNNLLNAEWKTASREGVPASMLMLDIDGFKKYNDAYGHQQGDVVLQRVARVMTQALMRPCDYAARWGGEEFAVLLHNTSMPGALKVAEEMRAAIEREVIPLPNGAPTKITVSIGVNTLTPGNGCKETADDFLFGADEALYAAKKEGKNIVRCAKNSNSRL